MPPAARGPGSPADPTDPEITPDQPEITPDQLNDRRRAMSRRRAAERAKKHVSPVSSSNAQNVVVAPSDDPVGDLRHDIVALTRLLLEPKSSPPDNENTSKVKTIRHHGGCTYSVGADPVVVTDEEGKVLQAFARKQTAMSKGDLETEAEVSNAPRILTRLVKKYPDFTAAIRRPAVKGRGGYSAHVLPKSASLG